MDSLRGRHIVLYSKISRRGNPEGSEKEALMFMVQGRCKGLGLGYEAR